MEDQTQETFKYHLLPSMTPESHPSWKNPDKKNNGTWKPLLQSLWGPSPSVQLTQGIQVRGCELGGG